MIMQVLKRFSQNMLIRYQSIKALSTAPTRAPNALLEIKEATCQRTRKILIS